MLCTVFVSLPKTVYDEWFITMYNTVYTALPVLGLSLFDQVFRYHFFVYPSFLSQPLHPNSLNPTLPISKDVNDHWSFQYPQLYGPGQKNVLFNKKVFLRCALHSCYSSLVVFFIPWAAMQDTVRDDGKDIADYQSFAVLAQTCLLVVVSVQVRADSEEKEVKHQTAVELCTITFTKKKILENVCVYVCVCVTVNQKKCGLN